MLGLSFSVFDWSSAARTAGLCALASIGVVALAGCPMLPGGGAGTFAPGLTIEVVDVQIPADRRPEVVFTIADEDGNPVALSELTDARFILAALQEPSTGSTASFASYTTRTEDPDDTPDSGDEAIQATYDSARLDGVSPNEDGTFTYKFAAALPEDFQRSATHQLGGQFEREYPVDGKTYVDNPIHTFRPNGGSVNEARDIVETESCNKCHTRLEFHGGARREVQLCILCHSPQSTDANSGNTVDFPEMIHKIHHGANLPSVEDGEPYRIFGFRDSIHDYSTVEFPQDIRNCTVCHEDTEEKGATQADFYKERPTLEGCASCHDRTWFGDRDTTPEGFTNHVGGVHTDNRQCAQCHTADDSGVAPVTVSHRLPRESPAAPGLSFSISNVLIGQKQLEDATVSIEFTAVNGDGEGIDDLGAVGIVAATIAYPAPEYEEAVRETISSPFGGPTGELVNKGGGAYTYSFDRTFPMSSMTFSVAMEGRREFEFRGETLEQGTASNAQVFFTLDGSDPQMRRSIVSEQKCNVCHDEIRAHGELRTGVGYCLMCHNPNATDAGQRPEDQLPPESIHFKTMIHGIHSGEDLDTDLTIFGFGQRPHDFTEVRFPAPQQDCALCHEDGTEALPIAGEALSTVITGEDGETILSEALPTRAACTSCHDEPFTDAHALLNTDMMANVESCTVCHGPDSAFDVIEAHRLEP